MGWLGHVYALSGRLAAALPLLEEGVKRAESVRMMWALLRALIQPGEGYLLAGRRDDAAQAAERALALAEKHADRANGAQTLRLLGELASRRVPPDLTSAEQHLCRALATAEALGMRPLMERRRLDAGRLSARAGD